MNFIHMKKEPFAHYITLCIIMAIKYEIRQLIKSYNLITIQMERNRAVLLACYFSIKMFFTSLQTVIWNFRRILTLITTQ